MSDQLQINQNRITDANDQPVPNAKLYFYQTGTTTPVTVYTDAAATVVAAQPVRSDAAGRVVQIFYDAASAVKVVVLTENDATVYTLDPAPRVTIGGAGAGSISFSPIVGNSAVNVQTAIANNTNSLNNLTASTITYTPPSTGIPGTVAASLTALDTGPFGAWTYNWHPYNRTNRNGTETGEFYNSTAVVANVETPNFEDGFEYRIDISNVSHNHTSTANMTISAFREVDASYVTSGQVIINSYDSSTVASLVIDLPTVRQARRVHLGRSMHAYLVDSASAISNTFNQSFATAQKITRVRFQYNLGSIDSFTGVMYRRRTTGF